MMCLRRFPTAHARAVDSRPLALVAGVVACSVLFDGTSRAATLPSGFTETLIASGLARPTAMAIAPDGRLFVCQQAGQLRVIRDGALLSTPFLTLSVDASGERGLLGVAFDPAFDTNHFVYVYYTTAASPIHNRVSRFTASGDVAVAGSEVAILDLETLGATNHNGGAIHFGRDGKLYVAVGDNGSGSNAQSLDNRLGKLLRINPNGTIPSDNPFYATAVGNNRAIWVRGLRNPFTFSVQAVSGRLFINDVGGGSWEEINDGIAGANYGWPATEGPTTNPSFKTPLFAYDRRGTGECAITGGSFYDPVAAQFPSEYVGTYFFADFCGGWIRRLEPDSVTVTNFAQGISAPVDLQVSEDGSLYYLARGGGSNTGVVYQITFAGGPPANLVVSQLLAPGGGMSGAPLDITVRTSNQGSGGAAASATGIWLSTNNTLGGDTLLGARPVPALAPGESGKGPFSVTLPTVAPGTYFLIAEADTNGDVGESHEGDNLKVKKLIVGPDLQAALAIDPAAPSASAPTTITVTTTNIGFALATGSVTRLYRSTDNTIGPGDALLQQWSIPGLSAKQSSVRTVAVTLPPGTYFLLAAVDAGNAVTEANETQNVKRMKLIVP